MSVYNSLAIMSYPLRSLHLAVNKIVKTVSATNILSNYSFSLLNPSSRLATVDIQTEVSEILREISNDNYSLVKNLDTTSLESTNQIQ